MSSVNGMNEFFYSKRRWKCCCSQWWCRPWPPPAHHPPITPWRKHSRLHCFSLSSHYHPPILQVSLFEVSPVEIVGNRETKKTCFHKTQNYVFMTAPLSLLPYLKSLPPLPSLFLPPYLGPSSFPLPLRAPFSSCSCKPPFPFLKMFEQQ